ncbi:MAG: hypothetical protein K2M73_01280 [Lachnospiraceae bacterium]|nr:hypothetical protein [Lachnospiraceae bacterium]
MKDDTIKLLRECDAGIKMGILSLKDALQYIKDIHLKDLISNSIERHLNLEERTNKYLNNCGDDGKEPATMAKMMSKLKTNIKLGGENSDRSVADLITDGCNMGTKTLYKYLHQYKAADNEVKKIVGEIIKEEEELIQDLRKYL